MSARAGWRGGPAELLLTVAATLVVGVLVGVVGAQVLGPRRHAGDTDVSPGTILVSADQMTLAGSIDTGCGTGYLGVVEDSGTVTVVLHPGTGLPLPDNCAPQLYTAHLRAPLGSRRLVDGVTRDTLPSFGGSQIPRPAYLPAGFVHRYDSVTLEIETTATTGPGCVQVYTQADSWDEAIWISQQVGASWTAPAGVTATPVTVRGHPGEAIPGEIEWTENGELIRIRSHSFTYATVGTAELVRIAESLR
ncbi:MAG TPA: hypothetical protein VKB69_12465 [Micromonosporaceae bacterium]|nr:hypothetical protein [Micromonosporaceae bacterium]